MAATKVADGHILKWLRFAVGLAVAVVLCCESDDSRADQAQTLFELAEAKFGTLTDADRTFFEAVANGKAANFQTGEPKEDDPANAADWADQRKLIADRITWLLTDSAAKACITRLGVELVGARIVGEIDLAHCDVAFPVGIVESAVLEGANLFLARLPELSFSGSHVGQLIIANSTVSGRLILADGFVAHGQVNLNGASIAGPLDCRDGEFHNPGDIALTARYATLKADALLNDGFRANGTVEFAGAQVDGVLNCQGGKIECPDCFALSARWATIKGGVYLGRGFEAIGEVNIASATIVTDLNCRGGSFRNADLAAILAERVNIGGTVFLDKDVTAEGAVSFQGAKIGGSLYCDGGTFANRGNVTVFAQSATIEGDVRFEDGFESDGRVVLVDARINGLLSFAGGRLRNPTGIALDCTGMVVDDDVVFARAFEASGRLCLPNMEVSKTLYWIDDMSKSDLSIDLRGASIGTLCDQQASWPKSTKLELDGFRYDRIADDSPQRAEDRVKWLELQPQDQHRPQPYTQLAAVLEQAGRSKEAEIIRIAREKNWAERGDYSWFEWPWARVLGPLIGYGYRPWRAFWLAFAIVIVGSSIFSVGNRYGLMKAEKDVPVPFFSFVYSFDMFAPLIDLYQAKYRVPDGRLGKRLRDFCWVRNRVQSPLLRMFRKSRWVRCYVLFPIFQLRTGALLSIYLWFHITAGWTLTTLFAIGLSGIVRA